MLSPKPQGNEQHDKEGSSAKEDSERYFKVSFTLLIGSIVLKE